MSAHENPPLLLVPRFVPQPLWGISGYQKLTSTKWEKIRKVVIADAHGACEVCGDKRDKGMIVDEVWSYTPGQAFFTGLRLVCPPCSNITHAGNARFRGIPDESVISHCAKVNSISESDAARVIEDAFVAWDNLHSVPIWHITVMPLVLERFPDLAILNGVMA